MQNAETPVQGETQGAEALGNPTTPPTVAESTPAPEIPVDTPAESSDATPTASVEELQAQLEATRKDAQKAEMRAKQLENEQKKQKEQELAEQGKYQELYEETQKKLEEKETAEAEAKAEKEALEFRDQVIAEFDDPLVQEVARKTNITWGTDVSTFDEAKEQLVKQLNEIKAVVNPDGTRVIHANNPHTPAQPTSDQATQIAQAANKRDFTDVLRAIPSVQEQVDKLQRD